MAPKAKPNGYSSFVKHMSRTFCPDKPFTYFSKAWKELDPATKNEYKDLAKRNSRGPEIFERKRPSVSSAAERGSKKPRCLPRFDNEPSEDLKVYPKQQCALPNEDGDEIELVVMGQVGGIPTDQTQVDNGFKATYEHDLLKNTVDGYRDLNEITHRAVFVMALTPAILAQGYKNASNKQVNQPVEVAVKRFSISEGLDSGNLHQFVDPGLHPGISGCDAESSGREFHGISLTDHSSLNGLEFHDKGFRLSKDYYGIYQQILTFMGYNRTNEDLLPPIFFTSEETESQEACLRYLFKQAEIQADEQNMPKLPFLRFSTLVVFSRLAIFYRANEHPPDMVEAGCSVSRIQKTFTANSTGYSHMCLRKLSCPYHDRYASTKVCALGAAQEACYIGLMTVRNLYGLSETHDRRFVYQLDTVPDVI